MNQEAGVKVLTELLYVRSHGIDSPQSLGSSKPVQSMNRVGGASDNKSREEQHGGDKSVQSHSERFGEGKEEFDGGKEEFEVLIRYGNKVLARRMRMR